MTPAFTSKPVGSPHVRLIGLLALFLHGEPGNDSLRAALGQINNASNHL